MSQGMNLSFSDKLLKLCRENKITEEIINNFVNNGGDLNAKDYTGRNVFWYVILNPEISINYIGNLLQNFHIDANLIVDNRNLLETLIKNEYEERAVILIENSDIDIDHINIEGKTSLLECCMNEFYNCAKVLIERNASVDFITDDDFSSVSALIDSYEYGNRIHRNTIIELLSIIAEVAPLNFLNHQYESNTLLDFFAWNNYNSQIINLLDRNIDIQNNKFIVALCSKDNIEIFNRVIDKINRDIYDPPSGIRDPSPLMEAMYHNNYDIADILLEKGANVNFYDDVSNILIRLIHRQTHTTLILDGIKRLLSYNVDLEYKNIHGRTAIFFANDPAIVNTLILYGANLNHEDKYNRTALYYMIRAYRHDLVKSLLNFGPSTFGLESLINLTTPPESKYFNVVSYPSYFADKNILSAEIFQCLLENSWYLIISYLREYGVN